MKTFWKKYKNNQHLYNKNREENNFFSLHTDTIPGNKKLHAWSMFFLIMKDILKKYHKIHGKNMRDYMMRSYDQTCIETNNINTLLKTKKQLKKNENRVREIVDECYFDKHNFTLDENFSYFCRNVFSQLYTTQKVNLIQQVKPWSFKNANIVDQSDIIWKKEIIKKYNIKYFIEGKWDALLLNTTCPETIFSDVALAVHPKDKRYKKYIGKNILIPIINKPIPIISDETLDSFSGCWIYRITPWHDQFWLEMAKKHSLPIDSFAIDNYWLFTKSCGHFNGKPLFEFFENIIQFLKDISNLESIENIEQNVAYNKKNDEKVFFMQKPLWQINNEYVKDVLLWAIENNELKFNEESKKNEIIELLPKLEINISNFNTPWNIVPVGFCDTLPLLLNQDIVIEEYKKNKKNKSYLWLTLIILNLIYDKIIPPYFKFEVLIEKLFELNYSNEIRWFVYLKMIQDFISKDEYKTLSLIFEQINTDKDQNEEWMGKLIDILENSFLVQNNWNLYNITEEKNRLIKHDVWFNDTFLSVCNILYHNNLKYKEEFNDIKKINWIFLSSKDKLENNIKIILTTLLFSKTLIANKLEIHPSLFKSSKEKLTGYNSNLQNSKNTYIIKNIGLDSWRFALLLNIKETNANDYLYDLDSIFVDQEIQATISKVWNAYRYVYTHYQENTNILELITTINTNIDSLWEIDKRILYETIDIYKAFSETQWNLKKLIDFSHKFKIFIENLTERYLEISKINIKESSSTVLRFVFSAIIPIINVYIPWLAYQLNSILQLENFDINDLNKIKLWTKNYKINIFIEICRKISLLKKENAIKKHEEIELVVQSGPWLLKFLEKNEKTLEWLLKISSLKMINNNQEMPEWYFYECIIDINIGIKKIGNKKTKAEILQEKLNLLSKYWQDLQYNKSLMVKLAQIWNIEKLKTKKQEIEELNNKIYSLENEIKIMKNK